MKRIKISLSFAIVALISCCFASCSDYEDEDCFCPVSWNKYNYRMPYPFNGDTLSYVVTTPYFEYSDKIGAENFLKDCYGKGSLEFRYPNEEYFSNASARNTYKPNASNTAFEGTAMLHGLKNQSVNCIILAVHDEHDSVVTFNARCYIRVEIDEDALVKSEFKGNHDAKSVDVECSYDIPEKYREEYDYRMWVSASKEAFSDRNTHDVSELYVRIDTDGKGIVNIALPESGEKLYYCPVLKSRDTHEVYKGKIMSLTGK